MHFTVAPTQQLVVFLITKPTVYLTSSIKQANWSVKKSRDDIKISWAKLPIVERSICHEKKNVEPTQMKKTPQGRVFLLDSHEARTGARDRNRTGTPFLARDFKSLVSTNFTTRARDSIVADR